MEEQPLQKFLQKENAFNWILTESFGERVPKMTCLLFDLAYPFQKKYPKKQSNETESNAATEKHLEL
jgi:hypothetical protein